MQEDWGLFILLGFAGLVAAFVAGLRCRDRRQDRVNAVLDVAISGLDRRVTRMERLHALTGDEE